MFFFCKMNEMTDLEKFIDLYSQFGIDIITYVNICGNIEIHLNGDCGNSTHSDKFGGYKNSSSTIEFTSEGKFLKQDFWE